MEKIIRKTHLLDAKGKTLGRLSSEIARLLQGKHKPAYAPETDHGDRVEVHNLEQLHFTGKKLEQKVYYRHSGYLGGLKIIPQKRVWSLDPASVLKRAVQQMLPNNKLRKERLKRLMIK